MVQLVRKISPNTALTSPTTPIIFAYSGSGKEEKLFIEKVASTLSTLLLPSEAHPYAYIPSLLHSPTLKLLAAPASFLEKTFPSLAPIPIHQIIGKQKNILLFSLAEIKSYADNVELKRSLWNSLKCLKIDV